NTPGSLKAIEFPSGNNNNSIEKNLSRRNSRKKSRKNSLKGKKKSAKLESSKRKRASLSSDSDQAKENEAENLEDWNLIDQSKDLPITTHLSIETIDEIFPFVWIETTATDQGDRWGEWVFIEPRKGLVHECEWVMIEEKSQAFAGSQTAKSSTNGKRKTNLITNTLNISWTKGKGKSRPSSQINEIGSPVSPSSLSSPSSFTSSSSFASSSSSNSSTIIPVRPKSNDNADLVIYQFEKNTIKNTAKGKQVATDYQGYGYGYFGNKNVENKDQLPIQPLKESKKSVKKNSKNKNKTVKRQRIMQIGA
ncbi:5490_t:CDS:1, partial [Dentiscutata heterogama]